MKTTKVILSVIALVICVTLNAQVSLIGVSASKIYEDNIQITYIEIAGLPTDDAQAMEFIQKIVLEDPGIIRLLLPERGTSCMFEAKSDYTSEMIVDAINEAWIIYDGGDAPKNETNNTEHKSVKRSSKNENREVTLEEGTRENKDVKKSTIENDQEVGSALRQLQKGTVPRSKMM